MNADLDEKYTIQVLQKAMRLLECLLEAGRPLNLETLSQRSETPKSTAFRVLTNLLREGYITETEDGYWLGLKFISFGAVVESRLDYRSAAAPYLSKLRDLTRETVYLATLTPDMIVMYLNKAASDQPVAVTLNSIGMTAPMHSTGLGRAIAAFLPEDKIRAWVRQNGLKPRTPNTITDEDDLIDNLREARQRGYAIDDAEHEISICCVAAPIFDNRGEAVAAISVVGPMERMPRPLAGSETAYHVVETARQISAQLGMPLSVNGSYVR